MFFEYVVFNVYVDNGYLFIEIIKVLFLILVIFNFVFV